MINLHKSAFLLIATAAGLYATPQLKLSTTALGPINIAKGVNGPQQTVTASNPGTGTLSLSATATATWLAPTIVNSTIQIGLNTASLAAGSYTEFVTVTSPGAVDAPQNISVTVLVGGVPDALTFYAAPGGAAVSQQVLTQGKVNAAASGGAWLSVSLNQQGSFTSFYPYLVSATPQPGQTAGDYNGTITFSGGASVADNKSVPVTLHLTTSPIEQFNPAALTLYSSGSTKATANVAVANAGQGSLAVTGATGSVPWLTAAPGNGGVVVTADPSGLAAGGYQGLITLQSNAANAAAATISVELIVLPSGAPQLSFGGIVDNATSAPTLAPGMIAQAYGLQLAPPTPAGASALPLPTNLGGVQIAVNGVPAPLFYTSSGQVNFAVPWSTAPGPATVTITNNGVAGNTVSATVAARAPQVLRQLLTVSGVSSFYGVVINARDGSLAWPSGAVAGSHPAKAGDTLTVYMVGLGVTNQNVADGAASPASPLATVPNPTSVTLGGGFSGSATDAVVQFTGLTPGSANLYQINVTLPTDSPIGDRIALQFQLAGATTNPVYLAISR